MTSVKVTAIARDEEAADPDVAGTLRGTTVPKPPTVKTANARIPIAACRQMESDLFFNTSPEKLKPVSTRQDPSRCACRTRTPDIGVACANLGDLNAG